MSELNSLGCVEVYEISERIKRLSKEEKFREIKRLFQEEYQGKTVTYELLGENVDAVVNVETRKHFRERGKGETFRSYHTRLNIGASGDLMRLMSDSKYSHSSPEEKPKQNHTHSATREWHYFTKPIQCDGVYYDLLLSVRETNRNEYKIYAVDLRESHLSTKREIGNPSLNSWFNSNLSNDNTISRQEEKVNSVKRDRGIVDNPCFKGGIDWGIEEDSPAKGKSR